MAFTVERYEGDVMMISPELGGRKAPVIIGPLPDPGPDYRPGIISTYQPLLRVGDEYTSIRLWSKSGKDESLEPMRMYPVIVELVFGDIYRDRIAQDMQIVLAEGTRVVGLGKFTH